MTAPGPEDGWPYAAEPADESRLGISLSGGGIRSATFALGVYQALAEAGVFSRARYLSAVSGGSYLAAGLAISHALCPPELQDIQPRPWSRGSREEGLLRRNLSYLAPGGRGRLWLFANVLYGLTLNLLPLILSAFILGRIVGVGLAAMYPGLTDDEGGDYSAAPWILLTVAALVSASIIVVGLRRFRDKGRGHTDERTSKSERTVMGLLAIALSVVLLFGVLPIMARALALTSDVVGLHDVPWRAQRLAFALVTVFVAVMCGATAVWLLRRRRHRYLRGVLAWVCGSAALVAPFVLAAETAVSRRWTLTFDGPVTVGSVVLLGVFAIFVHNRRYSMHLFYRERIQDAFAAVREQVAGAGDGVFKMKPIRYDKPIRFTDIARENATRSSAGRPFPELIMCAAVAASDADVPTKTRAASFTFHAQRSGNARLQLEAPTEQFEHGDWIDGGGLTLPSMMAISGAAISPLMGRFTLPAFRFLMAVLNIRLGVWIRNPRLGPLPPLPERLIPRVWAYLVRGWREPGALYVLKEGLGLAPAHKPFIYVTDGGHWENLGLTELLRRRCTQIIVVDASGDPGLGDIGRAMAIARAELGVELQLDPRAALAADDHLAETPVVTGTFRYPDGQEGDIYYARSVLWREAPSDLHLFKAREHIFPNHPTTNQFLSGELFDAYRALGWAVGQHLVGELRLPPAMFDEAPAGAKPAASPPPAAHF